MRREDVIEALRARPFQPFRMCISDVASYDVPHPELVMVTRTAALVGVPERDAAPPAVQQYRVVDLLHITRFEPIETAAAQ